MCIIQVYMPAMEHSEEEVSDMYEKIEQLLDAETKGKDYTVVIGDFNAVVEEGKLDAYVGHYSLGFCTHRGQMFLLAFLQKKDRSITLIPALLRTDDVKTRGRSLETQEGIR